jgi:hypothetical protein
MSYLGKISAIVTANTSGFSRSLNGAASDLRRFATSVERDITRATNDANKAFDGMIPRVQRLERALQAASSMKLSFRGFAGAIKDIDGLKQRLATLKQSQVGLVVRASGMRSLDEFRRAIEGIDGRDLDIAVRFGGLDSLREIRRELGSLSQQSIGAVVNAGPGGLARLREIQEQIRSLAGERLALALRVGGAEALNTVEEQALGLSRKDLRLLLRIGGVEQLDRVIEELQGVSSTSLNALIKIGGVPELDAVLERFRKSGATPEQIKAVVDVVNEQGIVEATNQVRALVKAQGEIVGPLARAREQLESFGPGVQAAFLPAFTAVSERADSLREDIRANVAVSEQRFNALAASALRVVEAIDRIGEVTQALAGFNAGTSFAFTQPEALAAINRAKALQDDALKLSPQELRQGQFAFRSGVIAQELQALAKLQARRDGIFADGPGLGGFGQGQQKYRQELAAADLAIAEQTAKVNALGDAFERNLRLVKQNRAEQQFLAAETLPFVDVGFLRARGVDERQRQLRSRESQIAVTAEELASSGFAASERLARTLPFFDSGRLAARAVDERQRQLAARAAQADAFIPLDDVAATAQRIPRAFTQADIGLGLPLTDSTRQIGVIVGQVNSIESALDRLPAPIQSRFVPALTAARQELLNLRNSADATEEQIAAAAARVRDIETGVRRASSVQGLRDQFGNFDEFINASRIRSAAGELEVLRNILGRVGAQASGPAVQAFNRFREAVALSLENPGNAELSAAVDTARNEAIAATSQLRGAGSQRRIRGQLRRAGDVGRFGADNISLALNQAAFAIDDFFSAVGGPEQKLRAISNNITQLGFVLGGTTGLFVALGAVIGGQAAVAITKWINNGRTAEDQTKALNDSLARQKTLVEEVADAFGDLGDSIAERVFSESASAARTFERQLTEIQRRQREIREEIVAGVNPTVQTERANQNRLRRELEDETDVGRRLNIQRQIDESQRRERAALRAVTDRRVVPGGLVRQVVFEAGLTSGTSELGTLPTAQQRAAVEAAARARATAVDAGRSPEAITAQRRALEEARRSLQETVDRERILGIATPVGRLAASQLQEVERLIVGLENPLRAALDQAAISLIRSANRSSTAIEQAQSAVADAILQGVPSARIFEAQANFLGEQLDRAFVQLDEALRTTDIDERTRLQNEAQARIDSVRARQADVIARTDALRREITVDPQRQLQARVERAQQNLAGAGLAEGQLARRLRELQANRDALTRAAQRDPNNPFAARRAERAEQAFAVEAAAIEAATLAVNRFAEALNRASQEAAQNLQSAQQAADDARRQDLGFSTPRTREERAAAEAALQRQIELERDAQVEIANARARLEEQAQNDPALQATFGRIREIGELLNAGGLDSQAQAALRQERAALQASIDAQVAADPAAVAARDASTREEEQRQAAARGRRLSLTPAQQAAEDVARGIEDIRQAFGQAAVEGGGLVDFAAQQEAIDRFVNQQARQQAPAIFGLADSVENAILQGPSRAALNVSDISTQEGARELNRLLRGEDAARDQNLVELQRQSTVLEEMLRTVKDGVNGVQAA